MKKVSILIVLLAIMIGCAKEEKPKTLYKKDPIKLIVESIQTQNSRNSLANSQGLYKPIIKLMDVAIDNGIVDIQTIYDNQNENILPSEIYCTETDLILSQLFQLKNKIDINSINITSYSKDNKIMLKASYNKVGLNKVFDSIDQNKKYNVVKSAILFNGRLFN